MEVKESKEMDWSHAVTAPQENELASLTHALSQWQLLRDDFNAMKLRMRETSTKMKALEQVIMQVMKNHNIAALDLKNSGGRVLFKQQKKQSGLGNKKMMAFMAEYLKSEEKANEMMTYIQGRRESLTVEAIKYENAVLKP
jgi:hypothetical protein